MITNKIYKILLGIAYFLMIGVNYLANALPIGGRDTGVISDAYPNLFAPVGFTFAIWGVIYTLLAVYVYQVVSKKIVLTKPLQFLIIGNFLLNATWIFAWHYDMIGLSVLIMIALLISLIKIASLQMPKTNTKNWRLPFEIYFGWISVATIANITIWLVSIGWDNWGMSEEFWTIGILLVGVVIGITNAFRFASRAYLLTFIWAYGGIFAKHVLPVKGFGFAYPSVVYTVSFCIVLMLFSFIKLTQNQKS